MEFIVLAVCEVGLQVSAHTHVYIYTIRTIYIKLTIIQKWKISGSDYQNTHRDSHKQTTSPTMINFKECLYGHATNPSNWSWGNRNSNGDHMVSVCQPADCQRSKQMIMYVGWYGYVGWICRCKTNRQREREINYLNCAHVWWCDLTEPNL